MFAPGAVPQEAITVHERCDHPCGAARQWEGFRLINQRLERRTVEKDGMNSVSPRCPHDWGANGSAKSHERSVTVFLRRHVAVRHAAAES